MRYQPQHTCFACAGCAFALGMQTAKKKSREAAKYVWMVVGSDNPCDIRRYAFSHKEAVEQVAHASKCKWKDQGTGGTWTLFKLTQVNKKKAI
jgi:hypothetical protein